MRVLTSPVETGAVMLALPEDVQAEAYDYPVEFFRKRVWHIRRYRADVAALETAAAWIRQTKHPLLWQAAELIYADATETLKAFVDETGIPVGETMAGKGSLRYDHPLCLGGIGATGTLAANRLAHRRRSGDWDRYPLFGFHHCLQNRLPESECEIHQHQCGRI